MSAGTDTVGAGITTCTSHRVCTTVSGRVLTGKGPPGADVSNTTSRRAAPRKVILGMPMTVLPLVATCLAVQACRSSYMPRTRPKPWSEQEVLFPSFSVFYRCCRRKGGGGIQCQPTPCSL